MDIVCRCPVDTPVDKRTIVSCRQPQAPRFWGDLPRPAVRGEDSDLGCSPLDAEQAERPAVLLGGEDVELNLGHFGVFGADLCVRR